MNSKRGSSSIFLMVILAALISIALALIHGVGEESVRSRADGVINLAGDSVMSEFDDYVQKEYGLFLLNGTDRELTEKLRGYVEYAMSDWKGVHLEELRVSGGRFCVVNTELIREQILEHSMLVKTGEVLKRMEEAEQQENSMMKRHLRHGPTIVSLPSGQIPRKSLTALAESIAEKGDQAGEAFATGTEQYLLGSYILTHFNHKNHAVDPEHFFRNEAEYILGGELSDRKNEKRVEMALKAMRFPLNLAHIYSDSEKRAATMGMAQLLTPGAAAAATQAVLAATWAYAEADNDIKLLWQGHRVPVIKDASCWATDLKGAVEGLMGGTAKPPVEKGYRYEQYLQVLLFFQDENIKLARILDLVQINVRKNHDQTFLIQEHAAGIAIEGRVNGVRYGYEKKY